jgi:hypothetical protein
MDANRKSQNPKCETRNKIKARKGRNAQNGIMLLLMLMLLLGTSSAPSGVALRVRTTPSLSSLPSVESTGHSTFGPFAGGLNSRAHLGCWCGSHEFKAPTNWAGVNMSVEELPRRCRATAEGRGRRAEISDQSTSSQTSSQTSSHTSSETAVRVIASSIRVHSCSFAVDLFWTEGLNRE